MFLIENFDLGILNSLYELANEFIIAVNNAFNTVVSTLQVFLQIFVSFFNRLSNSNTMIYSFFVIIFASLIVLAIVRIWRD